MPALAYEIAVSPAAAKSAPEDFIADLLSARGYPDIQCRPRI